MPDVSYMKLSHLKIYALVTRMCSKYYCQAIGMIGLSPHLYLTPGVSLCLGVLYAYLIDVKELPIR
jgi:hypothetical protein